MQAFKYRSNKFLPFDQHGLRKDVSLYPLSINTSLNLHFVFFSKFCFVQEKFPKCSCALQEQKILTHTHGQTVYPTSKTKEHETFRFTVLINLI